jgi:pimeloyl-ACP methyl ester carboxylesterase
MPFATLDGIRTHYITQGSGPALLMMASRGFNATIESWRLDKQYKQMDALNALAKHFTLVAYDRRESGESGGRVEVLTWEVFAKQAKLLLEHLGIERCWVIGPCMGAALAAKFAALYPEACIGLYLGHPVGGHGWHSKGHEFFNRHLRFAKENGLQACVDRAPQGGNFWEDAEPGPWAAPLSRDPEFARRFVKLNPERYLATCEASRDAMFPDLHVAGATAEELRSIEVPALVWPGGDLRHTVSAAHQMRELMPRAEFWDVPESRQTGASCLERLLEFRSAVESGALAASHR